MRGTMYRGPPRNAINHVARVSSGVNGANRSLNFTFQASNARAMLRDAPADIIPCCLLPPLSRSSLLCPRAVKWRINPRSQFNRRGDTAADFFFTPINLHPPERWASPDSKIDQRNSRLILFTACNMQLSRLRI